MKPCIGQRQANGTYALLSVSTAYGCTEPYFLIREAFQRRTAMVRYDEFRRPSYWQVDVNFAKTTPITNNIRFQVRLEAFNLFNSPMYDERQYNQDDQSADFGRINRNTTGPVELPAVHPAGFPADLLSSRGRERRLGGVPGFDRLKAQDSGKTFENTLDDFGLSLEP